MDKGAQENEQPQVSSFDQGIFGVPTYLMGEELYFGREHLPRIRWLLQGGTSYPPMSPMS